MKKINLFVIFIAIAITSLSSCKKDNTSPGTTPPPPVTPFTNMTVNQTQQSLAVLVTSGGCQYCGQWGEPSFFAGMTGKTNSYIFSNTIDTMRINGLEIHTGDLLEWDVGDINHFVFMGPNMIDSLVTGPSGLPTFWSDGTSNGPQAWEQAIVATQAQTNPPCALALSKVKSGNSYTVYVKVKFYTPQTGTYNLAVYAIENDVIADQNVNGQDVPNFIHNYVLRDEITKNISFGSQLFNGTSQSEYDLTYHYTVPTGGDVWLPINANNLNFVGVIYKMTAGSLPLSLNSNRTR